MKKRSNKSKSASASQKLNFDTVSQQPIADYFRASSTIDSKLEAEFDEDYAKNNDYTFGKHFVFCLKRFKTPIIWSVIIIAMIIVAILIFKKI